MSIQAKQQPLGPRVATADFSETKKFDDVYERIKQAETLREWSFILGDHIRWGNTKLADHVAIFNLNCATDCPNRWTDSCQVDGDECYAVNTERRYDNAHHFRQRQEYIWDCLDAQTWADAFLEHARRKVEHHNGNIDSFEEIDIRLSQSGDFRFQGDVYKAERIARILEPYGINVYTYTASDFLDWSDCEAMTVNASNTKREYGHRVYTAIPANLSPEDTRRVGDDAVQCPYELSGGEIQCGECRLCINPEGPDVHIDLH